MFIKKKYLGARDNMVLLLVYITYCVEVREGGREGGMEGRTDGRTDGGTEGRTDGRTDGRREGGREGKEGRREGASTLTTTLSDLGQRSEKYQKAGNKIRKENMGIMAL